MTTFIGEDLNNQRIDKYIYIYIYIYIYKPQFMTWLDYKLLLLGI
jgi:hypothetical protein